MARARITKSDLNATIDRINRIQKTPQRPYRTTEEGMRANHGNYRLSCAYGGYALYQMHEHGGVRDVFRSGHIPARELYERMHAFIAGMKAKEEQ